MTMYCHKLKNNVKDEFIYDKCVINNLNEFMKAAIEINNKLYERVMK